jgi:beta-glucosidase
MRVVICLRAAVSLALGMVLAFAVPHPGAALAATGPSCPWTNPALSPSTRAHELLGAMSLSQKVSMVSGDGASAVNVIDANLGDVGSISAIPSLCVPSLELNDAGNGIGDQQNLTTAFPDSVALAAAWDPSLAKVEGQALGTEAFAKGINVLLGPGMDILRDPIAGRPWEYLGEDPFLAGELAGPIINGIQSEHVIATAKHYALNDQETDRMTDSSDATARTMQEIDLPAFDTAVKAGVGSVMCSYNRVNSVYACENPYLLGQVLKGQFGFKGFVMSDFGATHSTLDANDGLDMEQNTVPAMYFGAQLQSAVEDGEVSVATLNGMVQRILFEMFRVGLFDHQPQEGATAFATNASTPASLAAATQVGQEGTVLLKDSGNVLPLTGADKTIALIGQPAGAATAADYGQASGSGHVPEATQATPNLVSPQTAITQRAGAAGDLVTYNDGSDLTAAVAAAKLANVAVVYIGDAEVEGSDRPSLNATLGSCSFTGTCLYSSEDQNALVSAVAAANPNTIVVVQAGGPVAMPWINQVSGVLDNWFPGQEDGDTIAPILFGDVDPSGHLPQTFPVSLSDSPIQSAGQYPGITEPGDSVGPHSTYSEGLLVGYRWYDAKKITPLFPFGYGLSYTSYSYSNLRLTPKTSDTAVARFTVTNTGRVAGADVAQAYVAMPTAAGEPPRQLKGFQRVSLAPGRSKTVTISLPATSFIHWDDSQNTWTISPGRYTVYVGDSSAMANLPLQGTLSLNAATLKPGVY